MQRRQTILLVEPAFPISAKSRNHKNFLPLPLLKLASYHRKLGNDVHLIRGKQEPSVVPDRILVTSLFTYWASYVREAVQFYKARFPKAKVTVGGIYASLMPEHCRTYTGCDEVFRGLHKKADTCRPAYDLLGNHLDYQIIHASRGCIRKCRFCGAHRLEPAYEPRRTIKNRIIRNRVVFYDNNFLANPHINAILKELTRVRVDGRPVYSECQSGLDGRLLTQDLAHMLKSARFQNPRIAWDHGYSQMRSVESQIEMLRNAGYGSKDIYVFMLYNYHYDYEEMTNKRLKCKEWGVQIADCRYRPLNQTFDRYNPYAEKQTSQDYYIHWKWTDELVRKFRRDVRRQNIGIRLDREYDPRMEKWGIKQRKARRRREADSQRASVDPTIESDFPEQIGL